jgi:hypothetical protein
MPSDQKSITKPTPGPWRVEDRYVRALKVKDIAEVPSGGVMHGKVDAANARLIAAAPDLLDALTGVLALTRTGTHPDDKTEHCCRICAAIVKARAAVAKAEGRQP